MGKRKEYTLEQRIYQTTFLLIIVLLISSLSVTLRYSITQHRRFLDRIITDMASFVAAMPMVTETLEQQTQNRQMNEYLSSLTDRMEYLNVIVVCDTDSVRYYHPDPEQIGKQFVGADEGAVLAGAAPYITDGEGTLGKQRRAFHAVIDENGAIIGFVMVSIFTESIAVLQREILWAYGVMAFFLLLLGIFFSYYKVKRLKEIFMGFQPEEFRVMYMERSEVLDVLEEGILAVNREGNVILINAAARRLLSVPDGIREGEPLEKVFPGSRLLDTLKSGETQTNVSLSIGQSHVITSRIPVTEGDRVAGAISIFRDRTEMMKIAEELSGARYMLDALRAFNHEFMNKLHVILGYLQAEQTEMAKDYITHTTLVSSQSVREVTNQIHASRLAALVIGKMMRSGELGIQLHLKRDSFCRKEDLFLPMDCYVTIIGNLLENAMEELNREAFEIKEIELGIYCSGEYNMIVCEDTGGGIAENIKERIFEPGVSIKGEGRGTGLSLISEIVRQHRGSITVDTEPGEGTCFTITFTKNGGEDGEPNV